MLILLFLLFTKHLFLDFVYQPPYMWQNKGTYGHLGGIYHSMVHAIATMVILLKLGVDGGLVLLLIAAEFIVHYHMDWFKMWYNARKGWKCNLHPQFWVLTGIDQYVHALTYLAIAYGVYGL